MPGGNCHRIDEKTCLNPQGLLLPGTLIRTVRHGSLTIVSWLYSMTSLSDSRNGSKRRSKPMNHRPEYNTGFPLKGGR